MPYPTSCSPQAWASAAPLLLLRSLLRFDADVPRGVLSCGPQVSERLRPLRVRGLRLGAHAIDIVADEHGWSVTGLEAAGLRLAPPPAP